MTEEAWGGPWPSHAAFDDEGLLTGGVRATDLAERFGTPLLVVDEQEVRERCRSARAAFPRVCYAVKAFTAFAMLRLALDEGLDLLAATGGEVQACLRAGASASRIVFHGNAKSDEELSLAAEAGVGLVVADGLDELGRLDRIARTAGRVQPVLLRVVPEVEVRTHEAIATGHDASKFGTPLSEATGVLRMAAEMPALRVDGLHAHIGSQIVDAEPFLQTLGVLMQLAARVRDETGLGIGTVDVGGGFGVRYVDERAISLEHLGDALRTRLVEEAARLDLAEPTLMVEPGRWLVANAGVTLYRVVATKTVAGGRRLAAVDGGMSDNVRPALYDAAHTVALATPPTGRHDPVAELTVVGRHCESGDTLAEHLRLPATTGAGDLLAFAATGAYTYSLASTYNRVGRPAVVAVADGSVTPWLRREDAADLDRLEAATASGAHPPPTPAGVTVRPARPADAGSYLAFWHAIVAEEGNVRTERVTGTARTYRRRFRHPWTDRTAQIVATDAGGRLIGHLYIEREAHPVTRHVASLGIAVAADARGLGVGSALMAEAMRWARLVGVDKVVLSVYPGNRAAIGLYRRFGFVQEGRLARHSRKAYGDEDEILMAAWIGGGEPAGRRGQGALT
ncbi:MAG TPA: diaminopimelate decarboxylase [Actinomycetota bacterium]|nr:diaminopimelate decarboxylase [Actinomycetota bacterium]